MTDFLQLALSGVAVGAGYALIGVGMVAIFSVSKTINLAQGEFAALAGLVALAAVDAGVPLLMAMALAVVVVVIVSGAVEVLIIGRVRELTTLTSIILTLGVSILLRAFMLLAWGPEGRGLPPLPGGTFIVGDVVIRAQELWLLVTVVIIAALARWFYVRTLLGKTLRASAEQPVAARLVGISLRRASLLSFIIAGFMGAMAGLLVSPIQFTAWNSGLALGLKGFVAATLGGGLLSIPGALVGGLALGLLESLVAGYISTGLRDAVAFIVLIGVLVLRPRKALG